MSKDTLATFYNSIIKVLSGPLLLLAIPAFLNQVEQGYWYTFTSIAALAVFADLGFSTIVLQFSAHEFAFCKFQENGSVVGDDLHFWKLASFFHFTVNWLTKVSIIVFPIIMFSGYFFLKEKGEQVNWLLPWLIYSCASAFFFLISSILSFLEGCDSVAKTQKIRMVMTAISVCTMLLCLYLGHALYALALAMLLSSCFGFTITFVCFYKFIRQLWKARFLTYYDWKPEFYALIWRYAISWCSGYFIFQLFTPLAFKFHGPVFAGKIGISIAMWTAGFNIANSWITAVIPRINMLIAEKKWQELDFVFEKRLKNALVTMIFGILGYFSAYFILKDSFQFFTRVLELKSMGLLGLCWLMQTYVNGLAIYLRSHKKEPMMPVSLFSAFYVALTTYICANYLSEEFLFLGLFSSYFYGIPVALYLYRLQKRQHGIEKL